MTTSGDLLKLNAALKLLSRLSLWRGRSIKYKTSRLFGLGVLLFGKGINAGPFFSNA